MDVSTHNLKLLAKAKALGFKNTINRAIWLNLEARGLNVRNPRAPVNQRYSNSEIMAMDRDIPQFLTTLGLWPVVQQLVQNGKLLLQAPELGINVNRLVWREIQKRRNPKRYPKSKILRMKVDTPLFVIEYNLWPQIRKMVVSSLRNKRTISPVDGQLLAAAGEGQVTKVKQLLTQGANVNARNDKGETALIRASESGHPKVVNLLIKNRADVNARNDRGETALIRASIWNRYAVVQLLLSAGANINLTDNDGNTALIEASGNGHFEIVKLLLKNGANIKLKNLSGNTALMQASILGFIDVVKLLIQNGANINIKNNEGETALKLASKFWNTKLENFLKSQGAV